MTKIEGEQLMRDITRTIVEAIQPDKIILFGSWAWGTPGPDSDVDLFIVKRTTRSPREVAKEIDHALWGRQTPLDIVVSTPEHMQRRNKLNDPFIRSITERGRVLYERSATAR